MSGNPVADAVYGAIRRMGTGRAKAALSGNNSPETLKNISKEALDSLGGSHVHHPNIATVLLHFALTALSIPSQRKVEYGTAYIDVAIPGLRGIKSNPDGVLLLCIPGMREKTVKSQIEDLLQVQAIRENIWIISDERFEDYRTYSVGGNFSCILDEISAFAASKKISRMGIGTI